MKTHKIPSREDLIEQAQAEDERAQQEIHELFNPRFHEFGVKFLLRHGCCVPSQHVFGVVNAAWGSVFKNLGALRNPNKFYWWGLKIVRNSANNHLSQCIRQQSEIPFSSLKKNSHDGSGEQETSLDPPSLISDEETIFQAILADESLNFAKEISPVFHDILRLQLEDDLDLRAVARHIRKSYENTRSIRSRGMQELIKKMAGKKEELKRRAPRKKKKDIE